MHSDELIQENLPILFDFHINFQQLVTNLFSNFITSSLSSCYLIFTLSNYQIAYFCSMEENLKRLNKFIGETGYCSRREADKLIDEGRVTSMELFQN
jgi:hypothetical protein